MRRPVSRRDREELRAAGVVLLLLASLALTGVLVWQAADAARSHRAATDAVLRDFAGLAGEEFVRRSSVSVGYEAFQIVATMRQLTPVNPPGALPPPDRLERALEAGLPRRSRLARHFYRWEPTLGSLFTPEPLPEGWEDSMRKVLEIARSSGPPRRPFAILRFGGGQEAHHFIAAPLDPGLESTTALVGFELDPEALPPFFDLVLDKGPLLPPSIGGGKVGNDRFSFLVIDDAGHERYRKGDFPASSFTARLDFKDDYQGILEGMSASVSLDAAAAPSLVIGGLPRSRLPVLLLLLLLSVGFVAAGIRQLRRERAMAALRTEFVSRVSHELRTPLTQIRMFAETLLLDRARSDDERRRALEIIDREARRLGHLVENALRFSRSERRGGPAGARAGGAAACDLRPLLREALESFEPLLTRARTRLESRISGAPLARAEPDALRQILLNLLDNAVKYGPEGQTILVGAETRDGACRLWVEDEGPGVPREERERIWLPFHRLPREEKAAIAGTGIGLSVVRDLTALYGGLAWVEDGTHGGARFVVELPAGVAGDGARSAGDDARTEDGAATGPEEVRA